MTQRRCDHLPVSASGSDGAGVGIGTGGDVVSSSANSGVRPSRGCLPSQVVGEGRTCAATPIGTVIETVIQTVIWRRSVTGTDVETTDPTNGIGVWRLGRRCLEMAAGRPGRSRR